MKCDKAATLVASYADGEIGGFRRRSIQKHLHGCASCAAKHQELLALRQRLRAQTPYYRAPAQLRTRVSALLTDARSAAPVRPGRPRERWGWLTGGALAGCAATILAWVVGSALVDWRVSQDLANEAVALHTQAVLSDRLIQVASSDQHTVKPWLSARLDYSPPVRDLAQDGFALSGGRLDMLHKQQVATLVYRYRRHVIDVFVQPEGEPAPAPLRTVRGFNVVYANGDGMDWLAVSDVSPDVLTVLVQRLAHPDAQP